MIISVNWLKRFTNVDLPINELATLIGARLVEIEEVIGIGDKYKEVLAVTVVSKQSLPHSDHLLVVKIDDGGITKGLERDAAGLIQVICGASNVKEGMLAAWLPPESTVPATLNDNEPVTIGIRDIQGVTSNGMLASPKELDLYDDHAGIIELDSQLKPGTLLIDAYELDDYLLDIENKSLTHRPDAFGLIGFAREVTAIQGNDFHSPVWLTDYDARLPSPDKPLELTPKITDINLSERYQAIVLDIAPDSTKTFQAMQAYLARSGVRPVSPVVDVTNFLMLLTGQPLHAFDYDNFIALNNGTAEPVVRAARAGETLELIDGRTIDLSVEDIIVCSGDTPVALAGAMGGAATEINPNTKRILLESATFNLYKLRATQMRHGIFSEAITRFTKGQPARLTTPTLKRAVEMLQESAKAKILSDVADAYPQPKPLRKLDLSISRLNKILGSDFSEENISDILSRVEFKASETNNPDALTVTVPYWRADIAITEDLVEEIGRISGFDNISPTLPSRDFTAVYPGEFDRFRTKLRNTLVRTGANELLTYSFVHSDLIKGATQEPERAFRITNAISPDLQHYRLSLTPSLLQKVNANIRQGYEKFAIFEVGKTHQKGIMATAEPGVPAETPSLAYVVAANKKSSVSKGAAYYQASYILKHLLADTLYANFNITPLHTAKGVFAELQLARPFESKRSGIIRVGDTEVGVIGEYKQSVIGHFKLPDYTAGFELNIQKLYELTRQLKMDYVPLSRYPGTEQDLCLRVALDTPFMAVNTLFSNVLAQTNYEWQLEPRDIYIPSSAEYKNITIRIRLVSATHTLTTEEANTVIGKIGALAEKELSAQII